MNEWRDRLIDVLLEAELGRDEPHDVTARVLARLRRQWWKRAFVAATLVSGVAAAVVLAVVWYQSEEKYPGPSATGAFVVAEGKGVVRGTTITTNEEPAQLTLGGYCRLDMQPHSRLRLEGEDRAESVFLENGEVVCDIAQGKGTFVVRTPVETVSVLGTRFMVKVSGGDEMGSKSVIVKVMVGTVLVAGSWGTVELTGGQERLFAQEKKEDEKPLAGKAGTTIGELTVRKGAQLQIKADGDEKARLYSVRWLKEKKQFDPEMIKTFQGIPIGSRIEVQWTHDGERMRIGSVKVIKAAPAERDKKADPGEKPFKVIPGTTIGTLTERKEALLKIMPDGQVDSVFHTVRWLKEGKMFDKELIKQFQSIPLGSRIEVQWVIDGPAGHRRINSVKVLKAAEKDKD